MSHSPSKSRISALEKLKQSNAAKLELETKKMEERIRSLKEKMVKEKEERERLGGSRWTSGRTGPLTKTTKKSPGSKKNHLNGNKVARKIKVLTDEPVDHYIQKAPAVTVAKAAEVNLCGQCENTASSWLCHECSERYCDACFSQFHLKGALRKHTKTKIQTEVSGKTKYQQKSPSTWRQDNSILRSHGASTDSHPMAADEEHIATSSTEGNDHMNGSSLLNGSYDEEESANSFAQALQEWRDQNKASKTSPRNPPNCIDTSCGTTNELITDQNDKKELTIKFNSSISYGDRLFLKKNRENNLASQKLAETAIESENNKERKSKNKEIDNGRSDVLHEENNELASPFDLDYREMIQNATTTEPVRDFPISQENMSSHCAVSVKEILPLELSINQDDQGSTCVVEECEKAESGEIRPTSRHGAVTIREMYTSGSSEDLQQANIASNTHNYVSPSITAKPFFLKPSGKAKKQPVRTMSAGRKKTPRKDERQRSILMNKERQSPKMSSKKNKHPGKESPVHQVMNEISPSIIENTSKKQSPLKKNDVHQRPRPPSRNNSSNETRVPIRQAWKPKHSHKELSSFFLAGVDREGEDIEQCEDEHNERSSSTPITTLGRGSLSQTWNPVQSFTQLTTPDSIDLSSSVEKSMSVPEEHYATSASSEEKHLDRGSTNSDDLQLTRPKFQELKGLHRSIGSKDDYRNIEEDELLELKALDDFGTGDQDDDDLATLNDLAWELASSTGRLTRCEEDLPLDSDDDSIEDKDGGSGLTSPCTLERSFRESIMDDFEEMERKIMEQDL